MLIGTRVDGIKSTYPLLHGLPLTYQGRLQKLQLASLELVKPVTLNKRSAVAAEHIYLLLDKVARERAHSRFGGKFKCST